MLVQVAEQFYERDELATAVARNFVLPLAVTLPVLGVLIWVSVGRAMRSLTHVNEQVASRAADNLTSIDVADAPAEIGGLVTNLNRLFGRVQGLIEQERHFTADAAHELRTPLAGIRAQRRSLGGDGRRRAGPGARRRDGRLRSCDPRRRADVDAGTAGPGRRGVSADIGGARRRAQGDLGELAPLAVAKHMDLALNDGRGAFVSGDAGLLAILFRNVIDNAVRYSPPGAKVDVDVEVTASDVRVTVRDTGPGIPADQRARTSVVASIGRLGHRHRGAGLGCRLCSGSSTCIEARSGSTRLRRTLGYWSRLLYRVLWDERACTQER